MHGTANTGATGLRSFIERLERLAQEKKAISEDMKQVMTEAKGLGYDPKAIRQMIKERAMDPAEREEWQAICEVYRAHLNLLNGTPLGEAARRRFEADNAPDGADAGEAPEAPYDAAEPPPVDWEAECAKARAKGAAAAEAGEKVFANPYLANDKRRAAWDEGYCEASGSDGMDLPPHLRRKEKPKKKKDEKDGDE